LLARTGFALPHNGRVDVSAECFIKNKKFLRTQVIELGIAERASNIIHRINVLTIIFTSYIIIMVVLKKCGKIGTETTAYAYARAQRRHS
jgi:hypothetical protein